MGDRGQAKPPGASALDDVADLDQLGHREGVVLRLGRYAWAFIGIALALIALFRVASWVSLVIIPLLLALFPAALLSPLTSWLKRKGLPPTLVAILLVLALAGVVAGALSIIVPRTLAELPALADAFARGTQQFQSWVTRVAPVDFNDLGQLPQRALDAWGGPGAVVGSGLTAVRWVGNFTTGLLLFLVALFFYVKDGPAIWRGIADLLPASQRDQVDEVAGHIWWTLGAYLRGQVLVALVDGIFIGLGLWALDIPLALPLAVLTFLGGLLPILGAFVSGLLAVVVALADQGLTKALLVLALVLIVQQIEGNVLEPLIMSRIVALHPLMILFAVTAGALLLGVLGAFLAVPATAALARVVDYARGRPPAAGPKDATTTPVAAVVTGELPDDDDDRWEQHDPKGTSPSPGSDSASTPPP